MSRFKKLEEYVDGGSIKEAVGFGMKKFSFDTLPPQLSELVIAKVPVRSSLELLKVNKKLRGYQLHYGPFKNRKVQTIRLRGRKDGAHFSFAVGVPRKWIGKQDQSILIDGFPINDLGLVGPQETPSRSYLRLPPNQWPAYSCCAPTYPSPLFSYSPTPSVYSNHSATYSTTAPEPYRDYRYYDFSVVYERPLQHLLRSIKSCVRLEYGHYSTHSCPLKIDVVKEFCFDSGNLKSALDLMQPVVTNHFHLQLTATQKIESIEKILGPMIKGCKELSIWNSVEIDRQVLELVADPKSIWLWIHSIDKFKQAITDEILQNDEAPLMLSLEHGNVNEGLAEIRRWLSEHRELKDSWKRTEILESFATHPWMDREWLSRKWDWMESRMLMEVLDLLSLKEKLGQSPKNEEVFVFEKAARKFAIIVWASRKRIYCVRFFPSFWV